MRNKIVLLFLILFIPFFVNALEDSEPPTLSNVYLSSYNLTPGENVTVYVSGNDNLTGIGAIDVELRLKSDNSQYFTLDTSVTPANNFTYTKQVPENIIPGEYEIFVVQVWDAAWNLNTYYMDSEGWPFSNVDVTVNDNGKDYTAPILSNFRISPQSTTYPDNFTITVDATDDKSGVTQVSFTYEINGKMYNYNLNKISGNTYSTKVTVEESVIYSDAKFITAYVYDASGNSSKYDTDVNRDPYRNFKEIILTQNLDVVFTNKIVDNENPKLNSCSYSSTKVSAPGTVTISCSITDDIGIGNVKLFFQGYDGNNNLIDSLILYPTYDPLEKKAIFNYTFNQYTPNSTFFIDRVEITDTSGKTSVYTIYDDDNLNMKKNTLTLIQAISSDVTVSTVDNNYINEVKNMDEGKTITIDTTSTSVLNSEVFDSIKGKDINIIVVNDGIQWIFNGKDIINKTKNINTKINIYKINEHGNKDYSSMFDKDTNAIVIEFADNGLLPGKALIKIKADYSLRDYIGDTDLYVYHVQSIENGLEAIAKKIDLSSDGYYEFYITHNSKYIISKKSANKSSIVKDSTSDLENDKLILEKDNNEEIMNETDELIYTTGVKKETNIYYIIIPSIIVVIIIIVTLFILRKKGILFKKKKNKNTKKTKKKKK